MCILILTLNSYCDFDKVWAEWLDGSDLLHCLKVCEESMFGVIASMLPQTTHRLLSDWREDSAPRTAPTCYLYHTCDVLCKVSVRGDKAYSWSG